MGGYQNYGPFVGPLNTRCRIIPRTQKGTTILIATHMYICMYMYGELPGLIRVPQSALGRLIWNIGSSTWRSVAPNILYSTIRPDRALNRPSFGLSTILLYIYVYIYIYLYVNTRFKSRIKGLMPETWTNARRKRESPTGSSSFGTRTRSSKATQVCPVKAGTSTICTLT